MVGIIGKKTESYNARTKEVQNQNARKMARDQAARLLQDGQERRAARQACETTGAQDMKKLLTSVQNLPCIVAFFRISPYLSVFARYLSAFFRNLHKYLRRCLKIAALALTRRSATPSPKRFAGRGLSETRTVSCPFSLWEKVSRSDG
jgi:hypothetical protein